MSSASFTVCLSLCISGGACLSHCLSAICLSLWLRPLPLLIYFPSCLDVSLSTHLSISLSGSLTAYLPVCLSALSLWQLTTFSPVFGECKFASLPLTCLPARRLSIWVYGCLLPCLSCLFGSSGRLYASLSVCLSLWTLILYASLLSACLSGSLWLACFNACQLLYLSGSLAATFAYLSESLAAYQLFACMFWACGCQPTFLPVWNLFVFMAAYLPPCLHVCCLSVSLPPCLSAISLGTLHNSLPSYLSI